MTGTISVDKSENLFKPFIHLLTNIFTQRTLDICPSCSVFITRFLRQLLIINVNLITLNKYKSSLLLKT